MKKLSESLGELAAKLYSGNSISAFVPPGPRERWKGVSPAQAAKNILGRDEPIREDHLGLNTPNDKALQNAGIKQGFIELNTNREAGGPQKKIAPVAERYSSLDAELDAPFMYSPDHLGRTPKAVSGDRLHSVDKDHQSFDDTLCGINYANYKDKEPIDMLRRKTAALLSAVWKLGAVPGIAGEGWGDIPNGPEDPNTDPDLMRRQKVTKEDGAIRGARWTRGRSQVPKVAADTGTVSSVSSTTSAPASSASTKLEDTNKKVKDSLKSIKPGKFESPQDIWKTRANTYGVQLQAIPKGMPELDPVVPNAKEAAWLHGTLSAYKKNA